MRRSRCQHRQPALGLRVMPDDKDMRQVFQEMGIDRPFEEAIKSPAIEICVRNTAEARINRQRTSKNGRT